MILVKAIFVLVFSGVSLLASAQQSSVSATPDEAYGWFRSDSSAVFRAFMEHYRKFIREDEPKGQCEARLLVTRDGYLAGIQLVQCPSDEVRNAVYQRLAAAVPFPRMPNLYNGVDGKF
jgi:hypothetical protein